MSVDEMKKIAIEKIRSLNDEEALKELLTHLQKIAEGEQDTLSRHYESIKSQYHSVLQKLAK